MNYNNNCNIFRKLLSGCRTIDDAIYLSKLYNFTDIEKELITSIINAKKYDNNILDTKKLIYNMNDINNCKYKEEAINKINNMLLETSDMAQIKCLKRIATMKEDIPQNIIFDNYIKKNNNPKIFKNCPHCNCVYEGTKDDQYVICGCADDGYDLDGCNRDWCFKCNKKLCKSWYDDQLFILINRIHTKKCCEQHAKINGFKYSTDYCQCLFDFKFL